MILHSKFSGDGRLVYTDEVGEVVLASVPAEFVATVLLQLPEGDPPSEFRIFKAGTNDTSKGPFVFDKESAENVMKAFGSHGMDRLPLDFDHGMFSMIPTQESSKAAGWFVPAIRNTADGPELWATDVQWTPTAEQALKDREFRFISPAFESTRDKRIKRLLNVALTNLPATKNLEPLVANEKPAANGQPQRSETMNALLEALSAKDEAEGIKTVIGLLSLQQRIESLTGKKELIDILKRVEEGLAAEESVVKLAAKLATIEAEREQGERVELLGKVPPSMRGVLGDDLSIDQLKRIVSGLATTFPDAGTGEGANRQPSGDASERITLNRWDKEMIEKFNFTEEQYIESIKLERKEQAAIREALKE